MIPRRSILRYSCIYILHLIHCTHHLKQTLGMHAKVAKLHTHSVDPRRVVCAQVSARRIFTSAAEEKEAGELRSYASVNFMSIGSLMVE